MPDLDEKLHFRLQIALGQTSAALQLRGACMGSMHGCASHQERALSEIT